jgi:L-lactate dehydrogenase complex protein LldE
VIFPDNQTCCGQPAYTSGFPDEARQVVESQLDLFPGDYPHRGALRLLRRHDPLELGEGRAPTTRPSRPGRLPSPPAPTSSPSFWCMFWLSSARIRALPLTVALHTSCSARREMGTLLVGRELLARLGNVTLAIHDHESECCGFGGTFSLKHPDVSTAMVSDKVASIKATGACQMVTADCGCMLNITQRAAREDQDAGRASASLPGEHLATFLLRRTGGKPSGEHA